MHRYQETHLTARFVRADITYPFEGQKDRKLGHKKSEVGVQNNLHFGEREKETNSANIPLLSLHTIKLLQMQHW